MLLLQWTQDRSLVGEPISQRPHDPAKKQTEKRESMSELGNSCVLPKHDTNAEIIKEIVSGLVYIKICVAMI